MHYFEVSVLYSDIIFIYIYIYILKFSISLYYRDERNNIKIIRIIGNVNNVNIFRFLFCMIILSENATLLEESYTFKNNISNIHVF